MKQICGIFGDLKNILYLAVRNPKVGVRQKVQNILFKGFAKQ
jgi:hypothetical protein